MKKLTSLLFIICISISIFAQDTTSSFIESGDEKDVAEDFEGAVADYTKAIEKDDTNPDVFVKRGVVYFKLHKYSKSIRDFNAAIKLDPENAIAYNHRGMVNYYSNKSILAMQDYDIAISIDAKYGHAFYNRGLVKLDFGDHSGAYRDFKKAKKYKYDKAEDAIWKYCTDRLFIVTPEED